MTLSRADIQAQIDLVRQGQSIALTDLTPLISSWLDTLVLSTPEFTQEFMKQHLLSDLTSYEGVI